MRLDAPKPRVAVAEDDPAILELVTVRLQLAGYEVAYARDGLEALAIMPGFRPHAMVLDINMPRLDGFGVLAAMRERPALAGLPVLVLTARNAAPDVQRARALGAADYLSKPFDDAQLLVRVRRLLRDRERAAAPAPPPAPPPAPAPAPAPDTDVFLI